MLRAAFRRSTITRFALLTAAPGSPASRLLQNGAQKKTPDRSRGPIGGFEAKPYKSLSHILVCCSRINISPILATLPVSSNVRRGAGERTQHCPQSRRACQLSRRVRSATISQRDGRRARVILLAAQGCTRVEIARLTGFSLPVITCWCQRFQAQRLEGLLDKPGRGRKPFLPLEAVRRVLEQVTQPRIGEPR